MSRKTIIYLCLSVLLLAYIVYVVPLCGAAAADDRYKAVQIVVNDSARTGFVSSADVERALDGISNRAKIQPRKSFNTLEMQNKLRALDKIEDATVLQLNNGVLLITVTPMRPVARVFDNGINYYINAEGKKIPADALHRVDVPVVSGHFRDGKEVAALLPMFAQIHSNADYDALVTSVSVDRRGDIIIIPPVAGHVINFGDTSAVKDKFERLRRFYHNVMPAKGWTYYDTLSVKYRGRIVASRRVKKVVDAIPMTQLEGIVDELPDDGTMIANPGDSIQLPPHHHI